MQPPLKPCATVIICAAIVAMLGGCVNASHGSFCQIYQPVYTSNLDSVKTKEQVDLNNVVWLEMCR